MAINFLFLITVLSITSIRQNYCCVKDQLKQYEVYECRWTCPGGVRIDEAAENSQSECDSQCQPSKCLTKCGYVEKYEQECCDGYDRGKTKRDSPCEDIDECELERLRGNSSSMAPLCDSSANLACFNTEGSYRCDCKEGFIPSTEDTTCVDLDECQQKPFICGAPIACHNTPGSYQCACPLGYSEVRDENGKLECIDIDECQDKERPEPCTDSHTECENSIGSYNCKCAPGFEKAPDGDYCRDINECTREGITCINGFCENTDGSYRCVCLTGFAKNVTVPPYDNTTCFDIDECSTGQVICPVNTTCFNEPGTYKCVWFCPTGYRKNDRFGCLDINECSESHNCSHYCHNEPGGYSCSCPLIFRLNFADGRTCLFGYLDDELMILLMVSVGVLGFVVVLCVCFCSSRIYQDNKRGQNHRHGGSFGLMKNLFSTQKAAKNNSYYISTIKTRKVKRTASQSSHQRFAALENSQSSQSQDSARSQSTRFDSPSSFCEHSGDYDAPDYATATRMPGNYLNSMAKSRSQSNAGGKRYHLQQNGSVQSPPPPVPPPLLSPYHHQLSQSQIATLQSIRSLQLGNRPRNFSTPAVPVLPINGRFPAAMARGRPHAATILGVPDDIPDVSRRPVLLPRYASTDDESPIICLLDEEEADADNNNHNNDADDV